MSEFGLDPWMAVVAAFAFALAVGFFNGWLVTRTGLPSFIVTLGMLFLLRGATIGITRLITDRTQVGGLRGHHRRRSVRSQFFAGDIVIGELQIAALVFWWILVTVVAPGMSCTRTTFGNWIFGTGGNQTAARNVGVPVRGVKISLFMATAASAALLACIQVFNVARPTSCAGEQKELEAIAAAVIGGNAADRRLRLAHRCLLRRPHAGHDQGRHPARRPCLAIGTCAVLGIVLLVAVLLSN